MRQNTKGIRNQTPSGKHKTTAEDRFRNSVNRTIQARRQDRFGQGMFQAIYGKSNITSSKIAERFIKIFGIPESWK